MLHALAFALFLPSAAGGSDPIRYTVTFPDRKAHKAAVALETPTGGRDTLELMMPVWSPGYYVVEDHAGKASAVEARSQAGATLAVEHPSKNHWRIAARGVDRVVVSYQLVCDGRSVTTNWVGEEYAILNGAAAFMAPVGENGRGRIVTLKPPPEWKGSATALAPAPGDAQHAYVAPDFDTLVDSPIVIGNPSIHPFTVEGARHRLVDLGDAGSWEGAREADAIEAIVRETRRFWGFLPYDHYDFLNVFRRGGGGLEHKNSTLLTGNSGVASSPRSRFAWLAFVSHEFFHAYNVKRLRPVELGPFDYEKPPRTSSLWIAEGLTTYYGDLMVIRAGLATSSQFLLALSGHITQLQNTPGRLVQTLDQSSLDIWETGYAGFMRNRDRTISFYVKGPVAGFVLDAHIRSRTHGRHSLDDVMRLAYDRYAGDHGFTADQFRAAAEQASGLDLKDVFHRVLSTTQELDYTEALEYFGLRFAPEPPAQEAGKTTDKEQPKPKSPAIKWYNLEIKPDATRDQKERLKEWLKLCPQ